MVLSTTVTPLVWVDQMEPVVCSGRKKDLPFQRPGSAAGQVFNFGGHQLNRSGLDMQLAHPALLKESEEPGIRRPKREPGTVGVVRVIMGARFQGTKHDSCGRE